MVPPSPPVPNDRSGGSHDDCAFGAIVDAAADNQAAGTAQNPDTCSRSTADSFRRQGGSR